MLRDKARDATLKRPAGYKSVLTVCRRLFTNRRDSMAWRLDGRRNPRGTVLVVRDDVNAAVTCARVLRLERYEVCDGMRGGRWVARDHNEPTRRNLYLSRHTAN